MNIDKYSLISIPAHTVRLLAARLVLLTLPCLLIGTANATPPGLPASQGVLMITDFTPDTPDLGWYVQNDNVMGGRSEGDFEVTPGELIFAGSTNTNGGGFSSIRTQQFNLDLSAYDGIQLRVKADGRRYTWQIQTDARYEKVRVSYWADFDTTDIIATDGEWLTVKIPFTKFYPQFRGFKLPGPELDPAKVKEFGLYIYDKKDGPFELRLDNIGAYSDK